MDPNSNVNYRRKIGPITDLKSKGIQSLYIFCLGRIIQLQRVPLRAFWDLEKTVLHEIRVSGTVYCGPLLMLIPPLTLTYTANVLYVVFTDVCLPTKFTNNTK